MSTDAIKKRRVEGGRHHQGGDSALAATEVESGVTLAAIMAKMNEMETHNISMQNEIDGMKSRLSHMDKLEESNKELEHTCEYLETKCESLENSMKMLIGEQKWEYSAPDIPSYHWTEEIDDDYVGDMEEFLQDIKYITCHLRNGNCGSKFIYLGPAENDDVDDDRVLFYDAVLVPHWEEFATAFRMCQISQVEHFTIRNIQLRPQVMSLLTDALRGKIKGFSLEKNGFDEFTNNIVTGIQFAVEVIEGNPQMSYFGWAGNRIESMENVNYLVDTIIGHPLIDRIRLGNCFGNDINGYDVLCTLIGSNKGFLHIDLNGNNIRTGGSTDIPTFIATNPPLEWLSLSNNHLNNEDAILIAHALAHNDNLQYLHLANNDMSENGRNALSKAIYNPESLNAMSDCNHSCSIHGGIDFAEMNDSGRTPNQNRRCKIYQLLSLRNSEGSNVYNLNLEFDSEDEDDDTLNLVPKVLESVQRYAMGRHARERSLSITFEILRSWKMPELYDNCGSA